MMTKETDPMGDDERRSQAGGAFADPASTFDPTAPLPRGRAVIEASAGTGKTYQITNLVVRLLAEHDIPIDRLMVVTFTNAATGELRDRVRTRIREARSALLQSLGVDGAGEPPGDPVLAHLCGAPAEERRSYEQRLCTAYEDFDTAAISTIHGFCNTVLREHAFAAGVDPSSDLVADANGVLQELVDDWLSKRRYAATAEELSFLRDRAKLNRDRMLEVARATLAADGPVVCGERTVEDFQDDVVAGAAWWRAGGKEAFTEQALAAALRGDLKSPNSWKRNKSGKRELCKAFRDRLAQADGWFERYGTVDTAAAGVLRLDDLAIVSQLAAHWKGGTPAPDLGLPAWSALHAAMVELPDGEMHRFLQFVHARLPLEMGRRNERTYDDLLKRVADPIRRDPSGSLVRSLRARYQAVLIDEFQDTDARQWEIFDQCFGAAKDSHGEPSHWLYLIGDPKQAIYSFRGADVHVYLRATETALAEGGSMTTMSMNHRSDGRLVHAMNGLFRDRAHVFDQEGLRYVEVEHAPRHGWSERFSGHAHQAALRLQLVDGRALSGKRAAPGPIPQKDRALWLTAALVADDICAQLSHAPPLEIEGKPVQPGDVAVLVRSHREAEMVEESLRKRHIPCIRGANGNVLLSREAEHVIAFLEALDQPRSPARARALALTPLGGWSAARLARAVEGRGEQRAWVQWLGRISRWSRLLQAGGIARAMRGLLDDEDFSARIAASPGVERKLTNYRHLSELLHAATAERRLGPSGLLRWFKDQRESSGAGGQTPDAAELRLESDALAVQILTIHKSKGLQYPLVYVPFLWNCSLPGSSHATLRYHEDEARKLDVRVSPTGDALQKATREQSQENLRLLYVALTRARNAVTAYWTLQHSGKKSKLLDAPLTQVLLGDDGGEQRARVARERLQAALESDGDALEILGPHFEALKEAGHATARGDATLCVDVLGPAAQEPWQGGDASMQLAPARIFPPRPLGSDWRRLSYSSLTANRHGVSDRPEDVDLEQLAELVHDGRDFSDGEEDEDPRASPEALQPLDELDSEAVEVALADFPGGTEPGSFVHEVMEVLDFETLREKAGAQRDLSTLITDLGPRRGIHRQEHLDLLARCVPGILAHPLGEKAGGVCLSDLSSDDRLDELHFDLSIRGGDRHRPEVHGSVDWEDLCALLCMERPGDSTVPSAYLKNLRSATFPVARMAGFLTGSIDLVYRVGRDRDQRWFLCDYKTNRLRNRETDAQGQRPVTLAHYRLPWLQHEMARHHYFIQYHLYTVALHRFLRQRLPGYDYDRNMGGAVYLFVRGMEPGAPPARGVFSDRPPRALIEGLDRLFAKAEAL